jgi:gliding motility-associated lipoprotein GldD
MPLRSKCIYINFSLLLSGGIFFFLVLLIASSCRKNYIPKPRGYFRIDFPDKEYQIYNSKECQYSFEYPVYGIITDFDGNNTEPCWINIVFPEYGGKIHLTYRPLRDNLAEHVEDVRTLVYKHIIKADDIKENLIMYPERNVFGIFYDIEGNTASSVNFFITDSTRNFLRGSLYFNVIPNIDSLKPVIDFFKQDIKHLIETFEWN